MNQEKIHELLNYYSDVNNAEKRNWYINTSLIQLATIYGNCEDIQSVINMSNGHISKSGALAIACRMGEIDKVRFLLRMGASFSTENTDAYDSATRDPWNDALALCSKYDIVLHDIEVDAIKNITGEKLQEHPVKQAALDVRLDILKILIDYNKNLYKWNQFDCSGFLLRALLYGDVEFVKACIEENISIEADAFSDIKEMKFGLCQRLAKLPEDERAEVFSLLCDCAIKAETEIVLTKEIFQCENALFTVDILPMILQYCNLKRIKREDIIFAVIDLNQTKLLSVIEEARFLDQPIVRKKAKEYALAKKKNRVAKWFDSAEDRIIKADRKRKTDIHEKDGHQALSEKCFTHKGSVLTGISKQGIQKIIELGIDSIQLPASLNGIPMTSISPKATQGWGEQIPHIIELVIPKTYVTFISEYNFDFYFFPNNDSVRKLVFENGDVIEKVAINPSIEHVEILGGNKYVSNGGIVYSKDMTELIYHPEGKQEEEYVVPNSVKKIRKRALARCKMKSLIISDSVEMMEEDAAWDNSIAHIKIGSGVRNIEKKTFASCEATTELILSEGLEVIGEESFSYCAAEQITIPSTVRLIEKGAFKHSKAQFEFLTDDMIIMPGAFEKCLLDMSDYSEKLIGKMKRCGLNEYGCADIFKGKTRDEFIEDLHGLLPEYEVTEEMTLQDIRHIAEKRDLLNNQDDILSIGKYDPFQFEKRFKIQNLLEAALFFNDKDTFSRIFEIGYLPEENFILDKIMPKQDGWFDIMIEKGFPIEGYPRVQEALERLQYES